jgi:transcriptional regulator with XRE-family HTH domain
MTAAGDNRGTVHGKRRLATELRLLRDVNKISGRELARQIGISQSKVSRIEAGVVLPSAEEVTAWARAVGAADRTEALLERLTDAARTEVEDWYGTPEDRPSLQEDVREREAAVCRTRGFHPSLIPGLLQTPDYAQHVLTMFKEIMPRIDVPVATAERMNRQLTLYEDKEFEFLIGEAALRWRPGPPRLLLAQLDRIAVMSTKENVTIGIIPLLRIEATAVLPHPFTLYDTGDETPRTFVQVETTHAGITVRAPDDVTMYERQWAAQRRMALFEDEALILIKELSNEIGKMLG